MVFATAAGALAGRTDAAMGEVFAGLTRLGWAGFGGFGADLTAGALAGRTGAAMIEVFCELTRRGLAGFGGFGTEEGLEILGAAPARCGGAEDFGGTERGAGLLGLDERCLMVGDGDGLLRCGRWTGLGVGAGLLCCDGLDEGVRDLLTFEGLLLLGAGDDF